MDLDQTDILKEQRLNELAMERTRKMAQQGLDPTAPTMDRRNFHHDLSSLTDYSWRMVAYVAMQ
jgi:hypothetical protein